jgi:hypothetical protein
VRVSRHWNPRGDLDRIAPAERAPRASWPAGATAGVMLIMACCVGAAVVIYQVAGPRDVFAP